MVGENTDHISQLPVDPDDPASAGVPADEESDSIEFATVAPPARRGTLTTSATEDLDAMLARVSEVERVRILGAHLGVLLTTEPYLWIHQLQEFSDRYSLRLTSIRSLCADLAWKGRSLGHQYPAEARAESTSSGPLPSPALVETYVQGYRLRFDFRFGVLGDSAQEWMQDYPDDALIVAFAAFAALGGRAPQGMALYRASLASPNADNRSRHTCLAGIWFAYHIPEQAQEVLDLSGVMMAKGEANSNVFYRRAAALRKLGRFEQAMEDVDRAINMLGVGDNLVHQDYVRERELIVSSLEIRNYVQQLGSEIQSQLSVKAEQQMSAASQALTERIDEAQRVLSDGLLKIVEILGLFVALIGFVAGTGATALSARSVPDRIISMLLVLVGSLIFFVLLRLVTTFRRKR